jgi:hypothetical protein
MERNTWPGGESPGSSASNRPVAFASRSAIQISRVASRRGSERVREIPAEAKIPGGGFGSSGLQARNRLWRFPSIKRNNFGFFDPMVFNGIGDFRGRKGRVSAAVRLIAGRRTRFTVAQLEARELAAPVKKYRRGFESSEPPASNRLWAPALSLIQILRSHARASAHARGASDWPRDCWLRERCSQREAFQVLPSEIGGGVSVRGIKPSDQPRWGLMRRIFLLRLIIA